VLGLALTAPAAGQGVAQWSGEIMEASRRFGVPRQWISRVMQAESGGHLALNGAPITSRAGAMGLMQLMPGTWAEMRRLHGLGPDPYEPRDNILAGTAYLKRMYERFGYPGVFVAYNAGPEWYARHLATGAPLARETVAYVAAVAGRTGSMVPAASRSAEAELAAKPQTLFVALSSRSAAPGEADRPERSLLFVSLGGHASPQ